MKIKKIIDILNKDNNFINTNVNDIEFEYISSNSKNIKNKTLFICKGFNFKEEYLNEAINNGAVCYISEEIYGIDKPFIIVKNIRKAMALIAEYYYEISNKIKLIGITGTKGKTTTTYFIHNILNEYFKRNTAYISTIDYFDGEETHKSVNTTPDSIDLCKIINKINKSSLDHLVMEVSSQASKLDRIYGLDFEIGAFLNIGIDHISKYEHSSFNEYLNCKIDFLKQCNKVILFHETKKYFTIKRKLRNKHIITFGFNKKCNYYINEYKKSNFDTVFVVNHNNKDEEYKIKLAGKFNIINATCAIAICNELNIPIDIIKEGLYKTKIEGRMNIYTSGICPVIVDYAHNKMSIETLIISVKEEYKDKNIILLGGCPGGKANNRRKEIGKLIKKYASFAYLTMDDPNNENVKDICDEIVCDIKKDYKKYKIIEDRKEAIKEALNNATENDIIIIFGKGHEYHQIINGKYEQYESDGKIVEKLTQK